MIYDALIFEIIAAFEKVHNVLSSDLLADNIEQIYSKNEYLHDTFSTIGIARSNYMG